VPVIGLALVTTVGFVGVNSSAGRSVERFADVIEVGPVKNLYQEYANLCDHCLRYPELSHRLDDFAVLAWQQPPYRTVDSAEALGYLLQSYDHVTHPDSLIDSLAARLDIETHDYAFYDLLARMWTGGGSPAQKVALAYRLYELFPDRARALMRVGSLWAQVGHRDAAREALESAYAMDSGDPSVLTTYGQFLYATGRIEDAHAVLSRAAEAAPGDFRAHILASQTAAAVGDTAQARKLLERADSLADSPTKVRATQDWREALGQNDGP
jgi:tetratricopeptide (TPR) repeat protein